MINRKSDMWNDIKFKTKILKIRIMIYEKYFSTYHSSRLILNYALLILIIGR